MSVHLHHKKEKKKKKIAISETESEETQSYVYFEQEIISDNFIINEINIRRMRNR